MQNNDTKEPGAHDQTPAQTATQTTKRLEAPAKEEIALLPPFAGVDLDRIVVVETLEDIESAYRDLSEAPAVGFDTESRPTFRKDQESEGPHVVQFATADKAYLFQLHIPEAHRPVADLLASKTVLKVGFGLAFDRKMLAQKLGAELHSVLDLDVVFKRAGYRGQVGVKTAVAIALKQRFTKSKKIATTNWAAKQLSGSQIRYAANDAYAAVCVYLALQSADGWQIP